MIALEPFQVSTPGLQRRFAAPGTGLSIDRQKLSSTDSIKEQPGILIVDDEATIRNLLQIVLRQQGFRVWLAADGWDALKIYRQHRWNIAMVLLDVRMPGWDGPRTMAALQRIDPGVRCCFLTGQAGDYSKEELRRRGAEHVFAKPFRPAVLGSFLGRLVSRPTAG
jgi:CheY-like chemotaxis protein